MSLFEAPHPAVERLRSLEPDTMTPIDALNVLYTLRSIVTDE